MKWSGSFRLLLMLWLTAPSGQRVVPARASPSHAESTQSDGDTASLMIEADDEEGDNSTTPDSSSPAAQSNGGASPLKIEIDMEESTENGIGQSTADATEPTWHPYLIKISSGTGTATATATTTTTTTTTNSTSTSPQLEVPAAASLVEETIVMQLPEPSPEITSSTMPPPLLIIEELTPSSPSEPGSLLLLESPTQSILVLDGKEQKLKSKKQSLAKAEGKAPPHKQKGGPPPKKQKSKSQIEARSQPPPVDQTAGDNGTKSPNVFFLVKEVDQNPSAIQQHELPVAVQIIGSNTSVPGISIQEVDNVTRGHDISVEDANTIANSSDVSKVPGNAVEDLGTSSSALVVSGTDTDTTTTSPDTKVPGNAVEDLGNSSSVIIISGTDTNANNKTSVIIVTSVPLTGMEDTSTNSSAVVINGTDTDTIAKTPGTNIQEINNSSHVPVVTITDTESNTKAPITSVQESVTSTDVLVVIISTDTNSKASGTNGQEVVTNTNFEDNIPVTDTNSKAQSTSVQEVVIGTYAPVINITSTDTNSKTSGTGTLDHVTNTSAPVINITETNAVTEVLAVSVQGVNAGIIVPVIGVSETESATKTPAAILTTQGTTNSDETDSEVEDTFDISDKRISVTNVADKITVPEPQFKEMYFDQLVDHFSFTSHQKLYRQRYLLSDEFWSKSFGPIFLYTGNEGDIWDFANSSRFVIELASEQQALVIFAEHRYYGKSLPFGKKSYERSNMEFLTVEQTLADYVVLITKLKTDLDAKSCAVIAFGGSYGGMLSAYMRIKYPNVVDGALASSAPVVSTANLGDSRQFFHDVTKDFERNSPECVLTIRKGFQELEFLAQQQAWSKITNKLSLCKSVKSKKDVDHLYGWARNAFTYLAMFNYPYKTEVGIHFPPNPVDVACRYVLKKSDHIEGLLDILGM
ncbi:mucin-5AC-like isoform X2 [Rhincodon typus]|nr:mucin-5AC-like isoform X2 [Rhincodon typus]